MRHARRSSGRFDAAPHTTRGLVDQSTWGGATCPAARTTSGHEKIAAPDRSCEQALVAVFPVRTSHRDRGLLRHTHNVSGNYSFTRPQLLALAMHD